MLDVDGIIRFLITIVVFLFVYLCGGFVFSHKFSEMLRDCEKQNNVYKCEIIAVPAKELNK